MQKVAVSACLLGCSCRYDSEHNLNEVLLKLLKPYEIIPFCPEDACFGTPRATMDLVDRNGAIVALSNKNQENLSFHIFNYAEDFFKSNPNIELFIGKDRSPSCAVQSAKVYDDEKNMLHRKGTGLMAKVALDLSINAYDAEEYIATRIS